MIFRHVMGRCASQPVLKLCPIWGWDDRVGLYKRDREIKILYIYKPFQEIGCCLIGWERK